MVTRGLLTLLLLWLAILPASAIRAPIDEAPPAPQHFGEHTYIVVVVCTSESAYRRFGFVVSGHRYYNPDTGRWLSRDPIQEGDGPNLYAFIRNTPINLVDIDGRSGWGDLLGGGLSDEEFEEYSQTGMPELPKPPKQPEPVDVYATTPDAFGEEDTFFAGKGDKNKGTLGKLFLYVSSKLNDGQCLKRLTLSVHGNPQGMDIGGGGHAFRVGGRINDDTAITDRNAEAVGRRMKKLFCFCKPCKIVLASCNVGLGTVAQKLAKSTGCEVLAANGYCVPNFKNPEESVIFPGNDKYPVLDPDKSGDEFIIFK